MNNVSYTVLKLANGEDIICEVDYDSIFEMSNTIFEIQNPLLMVQTKEEQPDGIREGLSLSRWVQPFTEQKYFKIPASSIITSAKASPGLSKYYEYVLKRMESKYTHDELEGPTDEELEKIILEEEEEFLLLDSPSNKVH